jgi:hypothetical protein
MLSLHEDCSNDVAEYIYSRIESICQTGREAIQTVYLLLNNIYYAMGNDRIIFLLEYFSKIIPQEERQKIDNLLGNGLNILNTYDLIVNRLKKTKYTFDLISEIKRYSIAFRHLIEKGIKEGSIIYFLAGFRLNYDISIVSFEVKNKEINGEDAYKSIKQVEQIVCKDLMILASHCDVMFITNIEKKIGGYIINNSNGNSIPFVIEKSYGSLMEAVKNDDELYNFDTSKKDENGVYRFSKQDYEKIESEQCTIFSQFSIGNIVPNSRPLCVFKGIEESEFPENLLADEHGFVFLRKPIFSNVTWENNSNYSEDIIEKYKSLLWIPKETGDFTLNLLYSKIEETIKDNDIDCNVDSEIKISEDSRIVIICAHGESNIFETQRIIANNVNDGHKEEYYNIEKFLNNKDIVILFVCNSGKMKKDFLTEKINALTVSLFENGVKAVIAPKWPLHVDVVSIWFPAFFSAFKSGRSALNSFYDASKKVYEEYQHPGAWANLHYFGNPNIFIRKLE